MYLSSFEVAYSMRCLAKASVAGVLLALTLLLPLPLVAQVDSGGPKPTERVKRLKRSIEQIGPVDDHTCTLERRYRQDDYLAALTPKELAGYLQLAESGDADAMYLLTQIPKEAADGNHEYPYRNPWLPRAAQAGHPIAKYLLAEESHRMKEISDEAYLGLIEAAALFQGSGEIAWRLAYSYKHPNAGTGDVVFKVPRNFMFLKGDKEKALYWARTAAGKGNIMAAEDLCTTMYMGTFYLYGLSKRDPVEAVHWCTAAAQATCSARAALSLSGLYREGLGVTKSRLDALYWLRVHEERFRRNFVSIGKWEYEGDHKP